MVSLKLAQIGLDLIYRYKRLIRYLLVGVLNTAFGYGIFAILYLTTGQHRVAVVVATILGVLFNFFTTGRMVFENRDARMLLPFVLGYVFTLGLNIIVLEALIHFGLNALAAQAVTLPLIVAVGYMINSRVVFRGGPQ